MCRFLLVKFSQPTEPQMLLRKFSAMAKKSKALDGDWQGDGCGVAWLDEHKEWQLRKSLLPIWQERESFLELPKTSIVVAHARSASFPQHKGIIEFNQPYISEDYAFVFNGLLRGVRLKDIPGKIGAEKIWYLLQQELHTKRPKKALETVKNVLLAHSKEIVALNLGLATKEDIYSLNYFTRNPEYYTLHSWEDQQSRAICSEML